MNTENSMLNLEAFKPGTLLVTWDAGLPRDVSINHTKLLLEVDNPAVLEFEDWKRLHCTVIGPNGERTSARIKLWYDAVLRPEVYGLGLKVL